MKSAFYHIQHAYRDSYSSSNINESIALVSFDAQGGRGGTRRGKRGGRGRGDSGGHGDPGKDNSVVSCFYYKKPRYIKKFYPKLIGKNTQPQSSRFVYVMTNSQA